MSISRNGQLARQDIHKNLYVYRTTIRHALTINTTQIRYSSTPVFDVSAVPNPFIILGGNRDRFSL